MWSEVGSDGAIGGEEPLRVARRLEPAHAPFPLARRLVRILGAVIQPFVAAMLDAREYLSPGRIIARQFVGDDDARDVFEALEQVLSSKGYSARPAILHA